MRLVKSVILLWIKNAHDKTLNFIIFVSLATFVYAYSTLYYNINDVSLYTFCSIYLHIF